MKTLGEHREKVAIYNLIREASEETKPAKSLILDFHLQSCENIYIYIYFCCVSHQSAIFCYGSHAKVI